MSIVTDPRENGKVSFRTYEKFWEEHQFSKSNFEESISSHIEAQRKYKNAIYTLIKGASSAKTQLEKLKKSNNI